MTGLIDHWHKFVAVSLGVMQILICDTWVLVFIHLQLFICFLQSQLQKYEHLLRLAPKQWKWNGVEVCYAAEKTTVFTLLLFI